MHFRTILALGGMLGAVAADCNHDNCLRAVIASAFPTRNGAVDCSSFFLATVTPATATITSVVSTKVVIDISTVTTTTSTTASAPIKRQYNRIGKALIPNDLEVRQATVSPTGVPAYASACSGSARYSSACSCIGVSQMFTTVAAPLTTTLTTATTVTDTTKQVTSTSVITFSPAVVILEVFNSQTCGGNPTAMTFTQNVCNGTPVNGVIFVGSGGGTCGTASGCTLNVYYQQNCMGTPHASLPPSSFTTCTDLNAYGSQMLVCPPC